MQVKNLSTCCERTHMHGLDAASGTRVRYPLALSDGRTDLVAEVDDVAISGYLASRGGRHRRAGCRHE